MALEGGIPLPSRLDFRQADGPHFTPGDNKLLGNAHLPGCKSVLSLIPMQLELTTFRLKNTFAPARQLLCALSPHWVGRKNAISHFNKKKPIFNPLGSFIVPLLSVCCAAFLFVQLHIMMFHNGGMRCEAIAYTCNSLSRHQHFRR